MLSRYRYLVHSNTHTSLLRYRYITRVSCAMIKEQNKNGIENRPETHSSGVGDGKSRHFPEREYNNNNTRAQYDIIIIKRASLLFRVDRAPGTTLRSLPLYLQYCQDHPKRILLNARCTLYARTFPRVFFSVRTRISLYRFALSSYDNIRQYRW